MKKYLILPLFLLLFACPNPVEDPNPPSKPIWVEKSLPDDPIELGIDADHTSGNRIVLMWHPNTDDDLSAYHIYRGEVVMNSNNISTTVYEKIASIDPSQQFGVDTIYYDDNLTTYKNYYYYIEAEDLAENRSIPSDSITYKLLNAPTPVFPVNSTTNLFPTFRWLDNAAMFQYSNEYVIRVESSGLTFDPVWVCRFSNSWFGYENETPIPFPYFVPNGWWPGEGEDDPGIPGNASSNVISCYGDTLGLGTGSYRWKVKAISEVDNDTGMDEASSESEWSYFTVE